VASALLGGITKGDFLMRALMGLIKNRHGTYVARKHVPPDLQAAVARQLQTGKPKQAFLQRSLATKSLTEANVRAKPVLMEFDRILSDARASVKAQPRPQKRERLTQVEIDRVADYAYALELYRDQQLREGGQQYLKRGLAWEGEDISQHNFDDWPEHGISSRKLASLKESVRDALPDYQDALARGDFALVEDQMAIALATFNIELTPDSPSRPVLGNAVLRAGMRALRAIERRNAGEPVETPVLADAPQAATGTPGGGTLLDALEGWRKERQRSTSGEYGRAVEMFNQLHGILPISAIKRSHALQFREALQLVPRHRPGALLKASLPELRDFGQSHPNVQKIANGTVNKNFGAVQTIALWGRNHGAVPDDVAWPDAFADMRLEEDESDRSPFEPAELQMIFNAPVFTRGERPNGGRGEAAFWLPLLALFTGARQAELAGLSVDDCDQDDETGVPLVFIAPDARAGRRLKTRNSQRVVPLHPQLVKLGFLKFVDAARKRDGAKAWLFPLVAPITEGGRAAWSKWFGRYLRGLGITDTAKVFHSFRHNMKDALRRVCRDEELRNALLGHKGNDVTEAYGAKEMLQRWGAEELNKAMVGVDYKGLSLSRVRALGKRQKQEKT
jgi:integrase